MLGRRSKFKNLRHPRNPILFLLLLGIFSPRTRKTLTKQTDAGLFESLGVVEDCEYKKFF